jgi:hypothetical protein
MKATRTAFHRSSGTSGLDEVSDGDEDTIHVLESNLDWDASTSTVQGSVQHF